MRESWNLREQDKSVIRQYGLEPEVLRQCSVREYDFGERIITEGQPNGCLILITKGKAKVSVVAPNGRNLILFFYISSGLMGEVELFSEEPAGSTSVTALEDFRCISIPMQQNRTCLLGNALFTRAAAAELARKLLYSTNIVVKNTLYSAEARLCQYILGASSRLYFRDIMTDVAYSVGVSYRHLYRMMGSLCREGILEKTEQGYRICDLEGLKNRSEMH